MDEVVCGRCDTRFNPDFNYCPNCSAPRSEARPLIDKSADKTQLSAESNTGIQRAEENKVDNSKKDGKKKHGCRNFVLVALVLLFGLVIISFCSSGPASLASIKGTEWGDSLTAAISETDIGEITGVRSIVTLTEKDSEGRFKHVDNPGSLKDFSDDELLSREAWLDTASGKKIQANFYDNSRVYKLSDDDDYETVYWELPDSDGDYVHDVVSFETGEIIHPKNEEKAAEAEARYEAYKQEQATTNDVTKALEAAGLNHEQAWDAYKILGSVGVGGLSNVTQLVDNPPLTVMAGSINGHQVNFTFDNGQLFYVQITGFVEMDYDWYVNWRGKLKYGIVDKTISFDLYDIESVEGGHIAYYNAGEDAVIPWDEH